MFTLQAGDHDVIEGMEDVTPHTGIVIKYTQRRKPVREVIRNNLIHEVGINATAVLGDGRLIGGFDDVPDHLRGEVNELVDPNHLNEVFPIGIGVGNPPQVIVALRTERHMPHQTAAYIFNSGLRDFGLQTHRDFGLQTHDRCP